MIENSMQYLIVWYNLDKEKNVIIIIVLQFELEYMLVMTLHIFSPKLIITKGLAIVFCIRYNASYAYTSIIKLQQQQPCYCFYSLVSSFPFFPSLFDIYKDIEKVTLA